jgi:ABC-2 type transport system ATP-binding protein
VITTRNLTKRFGNVEAVREVSLDVREGDRYGLLGPNGSGKSTLVRMLLGLVYATSGEISVLGHRVPDQASRVLPEIGALIEEPAAYPHLSGRANLRLLDAAGPRGERRTRWRRVDDALEQVGLAGIDRRPVRAYSFGMRQRLGLAAALVRRPRLLILDEPTNGLDPVARQRMIHLVKEIRKEGSVRLLISSHLLRDIDETCDEVLILKDGRIAALCNIEEERRSNRSFMELETVGATDKFAASIRSLGCECASFPGGRIKLVIPEHIEARDLYLIASEQNVQIRRMHVRRDSLEDIFLRAMDTEVERAAHVNL